MTSVGFDVASLPLSEEGEGEELTSELYVAEVVRMEDCLPQGEGLIADGAPLVYHDQKYCGIGGIEPSRRIVEEEDGSQ